MVPVQVLNSVFMCLSHFCIGAICKGIRKSDTSLTHIGINKTLIYLDKINDDKKQIKNIVFYIIEEVIKAYNS